MTIVTEILFWSSVVASLTMQSWLGFLLLPVGLFLLSVLVGAAFPLKPIDPLAMMKARRSAALQIGGAIILILVASLLLAR